MFYMFLLVLSLIFIIILLFANKAWQRKTVGHIIFIEIYLYGMTGLGKLITNIYRNDCFPLITPFW